MLPRSCPNKFSIDHYLQANNRYALNELAKTITDELDETYCDRAELDDFLNAACLIGNLELVDKVLKRYSTRQIMPKTVYYAVKGNNTVILKRLLEYANKVQQNLFEAKIGNYSTDKSEDTTLIQAIKNQDFEQVQLVVDICGASVQSSVKSYPLHLAASRLNSQVTQFLLEHKAGVNALNNLHETPLLRACRNQQLQNVHVLLQHNADVNIRDTCGNAPLQFICSSLCATNLQVDKSYDFLTALLQKPNIDLTVKNHKDTSAFSRACQNSCVRTIELFYTELAKRVDISQPHSLCKAKTLEGDFRVILGDEFLTNEVVQGLCNATFYLSVDNIEYLFKQLSNKKLFCKEIRSLFEEKLILTNLHLNEPEQFNEVFKLFIVYDCYALNESCFYYIQKLRSLWSSRIEFSAEMRDRFIKCVREQIELMISYGRVNTSEELSNLIDKHLKSIKIESDEFSETLRQIRSLKNLSRNRIRNALPSLSDANLRALALPNLLQKYVLIG